MTWADMETVPNQRFLDEVVEPLLAEHRPDIVRIDPLLAYMGGDVNLASDTGKFLRNGLNPLLSKYGCAAILVHHTPKANNRDTTNYRPSDWQYRLDIHARGSGFKFLVRNLSGKPKKSEVTLAARTGFEPVHQP